MKDMLASLLTSVKDFVGYQTIPTLLSKKGCWHFGKAETPSLFRKGFGTPLSDAIIPLFAKRMEDLLL
jgi:hypothetical protein